MINVLITLLEGGGASFYVSLSENELVEILNKGIHNTFIVRELAINNNDKRIIYNFIDRYWRVE